ncbi:MAG TPA: protein kinase [Vicinamibacterales bacterium]|nr:protein kinase [Vicinamibacterales bacterium]
MGMTPDRWERVKNLYDAARACPPAQRADFLAKASAGDEELRRDVQRLLDQPVATADFVEFVGGPATGDSASHNLAGQRLGSFQVQALLGRGGMGEVYRAHDSKLGRDVAIKVLPRALIADAGRLASLEREARVVASLNHPNIAAIHGIEEGGGVRGLVLELVEGETLAEKLAQSAGAARSGLRLPEILGYARQIADALEAAHEKGITHRDLKPANIKITPDGVVKLLDFGIAKVVAGDGPGLDLTATATHAGLIIGTAGYMSPEQARGRPVDKRTDIWAFGCVLYEMLSGRMAFQGDTLSDTIAAILERDPDWSTLPAETPRALRRLLQRCLEKDPRQRLRDIGDARVEIEQIISAPNADVDAGVAVQHARTWRRRTQFAIAAAALLAVSSGGLIWFALTRDNAGPGGSRVSRFTIDLPKNSVIVPTFNANVALSPDGTHLAYTPLPGPVLIRRLDNLDSQPLEGSATPGFRSAPIFSPDGSSLAYVDGNAPYSWKRPFQKVALAGGPALKLAEYDMFHRGDWSDDGWLYWTAHYPGGIVRIRDSGGEVETVTKLNVAGGERSHRFASLLPGGDGLIYTVGFEGISNYDDGRIDLWDLKTGTSKTLIEKAMSATYSSSGHIVFARAGKLMAVPFDVRRREVTGAAFEVQDGVMMSRNTGAADYSLSKRGDLAYVPGGAEGGRRTLVWVDRSGKTEPLPLAPASYLYPRISPDGRTLAVEIEGPNHDFYLYDFERTVLSKITTDGLSHDPVWSPDGARLAFRSWQAGGMTMWWMRTDRSGSPQRLDPSGTRQSPVSFSPDGKFLAFDQKDPETREDAWVLPLDGGKPQRVAQTKFGEGSMKFSPDGRWVAYSSNESGRPEIYVQAFPGPGMKLQISNGGGTDPVWRRSGGELYYRAESKMMVVSVTTSPQFKASAPKQLWEGAYSQGTGSSCGMPGVSSSNYDVSADGQRFLMVRDDDESAVATKIVVVLNWVQQLKAKEREAATARK